MQMIILLVMPVNFNPRFQYRKRQVYSYWDGHNWKTSIHASSIGSDAEIDAGTASTLNFNPRFQYRKRLKFVLSAVTLSRTSIHASSIGSDKALGVGADVYYEGTSIHASSIGSDKLKKDNESVKEYLLQSTLPV